MSEVNYIICTLPNSWGFLPAYETSLQILMSILFGCSLSDLPLDQTAAPIREGGKGINIETKEYNDEQYKTCCDVKTHETERRAGKRRNL